MVRRQCAHGCLQKVMIIRILRKLMDENGRESRLHHQKMINVMIAAEMWHALIRRVHESLSIAGLQTEV